MTGLFNSEFKVLRNNPIIIDGIRQNNYVDTGIILNGRLGNANNKEKLLYQSRSLVLTAIIRCEPYDYNEELDMVAHGGRMFKIKGLEEVRDSNQDVLYLKIPVTEDIEIDES